eukprot:g30202.t1
MDQDCFGPSAAEKRVGASAFKKAGSNLQSREDGSGDVTAEELGEMLDDPALSAYFRVLGFDIDDARRFILLLDTDANGSISVSEFLRGCLRYRGVATGVDMHTCLRVVRRDDGNYELLKEKFGDLEDDPALPENGFSISENVEEEYEKLMRSTQETGPGLDWDLKAQIETWAALVEARIHLEPSLGLGHRLPTPSTAGLFRSASSPVAEEAEAVAGEVRQLLAKWMALQEKMAPCAFPKLEGKAVSLEPDTWKMLDARLQSVLDWALQVADEWKESTRLDARRSFKVLDQPLRLQMQAVSEMEPEKLRKRSTPPAEKYSEQQLLAELQGRRAQKRKAQQEVERRASKGRKIRYRPIEKLQNFMAARPRQRPGTDEDWGARTGGSAIGVCLQKWAEGLERGSFGAATAFQPRVFDHLSALRVSSRFMRCVRRLAEEKKTFQTAAEWFHEKDRKQLSQPRFRGAEGQVVSDRVRRSVGSHHGTMARPLQGDISVGRLVANSKLATAYLYGITWRQGAKEAQQVLLNFLDRGMEANAFHANAIIGACHARDWRMALFLLVGMGYNAAINVLEKASRWSLALHWLREMRNSGLQPSAIGSEAKVAGLDTAAGCQRVLEDMAVIHLETDVFSCSTALSACGLMGTWAFACHVLAQSAMRKIHPNHVTMGTAVGCCGGHWEVASDLMMGLPELRLASDLIMCNSHLGVCAAAGRWEVVLETLAEQREADRGHGVRDRFQRDGISFTAGISACEKGSQWTWTVKLLEMAMHEVPEVTADDVCFNAAIDACARATARAPAWALLSEAERSVEVRDVSSLPWALARLHCQDASVVLDVFKDVVTVVRDPKSLSPKRWSLMTWAFAMLGVPVASHEVFREAIMTSLDDFNIDELSILSWGMMDLDATSGLRIQLAAVREMGRAIAPNQDPTCRSTDLAQMDI